MTAARNVQLQLGPMLAGGLDAAADLLLGSRCAGCGLAGRTLCPGCRAELAAWRPHPVRPTPCPAGFPTTVAAGPYAGLASALITGHKDRQALTLAGPLGGALAASLAVLLTEVDADRLVLVPAPSSSRASRERGLDAGRAIAQAAARRWRRTDRRPVAIRCWLRQARRVRDQAGLTSEERQRNLSGALAVRRRAGVRAGDRRAAGLRPGDVVVITDDVVTTGATLTEAVRVLLAAGLPVLGAATVAATTRLAPVQALSDD